MLLDRPSINDIMIETLESKILIKDLGLRSYQEVWSLQKKMQQQRINERIEDTVILVEHEPVYTLSLIHI